MKVKYRVQWYTCGVPFATEYTTKSYIDAMDFAVEQARVCFVSSHRVQAKIKSRSWETIAEFKPAAKLIQGVES